MADSRTSMSGQNREPSRGIDRKGAKGIRSDLGPFGYQPTPGQGSVSSRHPELLGGIPGGKIEV